MQASAAAKALAVSMAMSVRALAALAALRVAQVMEAEAAGVREEAEAREVVEVAEAEERRASTPLPETEAEGAEGAEGKRRRCTPTLDTPTPTPDTSFLDTLALERRERQMKAAYTRFFQALRETQEADTVCLRRFLRSYGKRAPPRSQCHFEFRLPLETALKMQRGGVVDQQVVEIERHPWHGFPALPDAKVLQYRWKVRLARRAVNMCMGPHTQAQIRESYQQLIYRGKERLELVTLTTAELLHAGFLTLAQCEATFLEPISDAQLAEQNLLDLRGAGWESPELVVCTSTLGVPVKLLDIEYFPYPLHLTNFVGERVASAMHAMLFVIERV